MRALRPYLVGFGLVAFFTVVKFALPFVGRNEPFLLYLAAPLVAALVGGRWPGLVTALAAVAAAHLFFIGIGAHGEARTTGPALMASGVFLAQSTILTLVCDALVRARARLLHATEVTVALSRALTVDEVAAIVVEVGTTNLGAPRGGVWQLSADGSTLDVVRQKGYPEVLARKMERVALDSPRPVAAAFRTRETVWVASRGEYERYSVAANEDITSDEISFFAAPLLIDGRAVGTLAFGYDERHIYTEEEKRFIVALVEQAALALHRAQLLAAERESRAVAEREQRRFRAVFEHSLDGILLFDDDRLLVDANPAACVFLGRARGDLVGRPMSDVGPPHAMQERQLEQLRETGLLSHGERPFLRADGAVRPCEFSAARNVLPGLNLVSFRDIHDRKEAEGRSERLYRLTSALAGSMTSRSVADRVRDLAEQTVRADAACLFLVDEAAKAVVLAPSDADRAELRGCERVALDSPLPVAAVVRELRPRFFECDHGVATEPPGLSGEPAARPFLAWALLPLASAAGSALGVLAFAFRHQTGFSEDDRHLMTSVAEQCAVALDRARAYEAEAAALRKKDEFLAILGHELRNPLAPILAATSLIRLQGSASERELGILERQGQHLVRLVDDLLDVSRITSGKVSLHQMPIEISEVLAQAAESASKLFEDRRVRLETTAPRSGLAVYGDRARLVQVLTNLLVNAAKFTLPGSKVVVTVAKSDGAVVIEVRDQGAGIAPELLPHVFELFTQGRQASDRSGGGLGLGLAIARSIVLAHEGTIFAESPGPGSGTTMTVKLPLLEVPAQEMPASVDTDNRARPAAHRRRVLFVDDNVDSAEMMAALVGTLGYETLVANEVSEALRLVAETPLDAVVLDIGLPGMDGYALATEIRARLGARTPVLVAVTGYAQASDRDRALASGFRAHFGKPVDVARLTAAFEELLPPA